MALVLVAALGVTGTATADDPVGHSGPPWIASDQADYAPGAAVTLNGGNWAAGEVVHINVNDDVGQSWSRDVDVTANADGNITDAFNLPDWFVATYLVKATGASGSVVTASFTDGDIRVRAGRPPGNVNTAVTIAAGGLKLFSTNDCSGASSSSNASSFTTSSGGGNGYVNPSPAMNAGIGTSFSIQAPSSVTVGATTYLFSSWQSDNGNATSVSTSGTTACFLSNANGQISLTAAYTDNSPPNNVGISINDGAAWATSSSGSVTVDLTATDDFGVTRYRLAETQAGLAGATDVAVSPAEPSFSRSDVAFTLTGAEAASKAVWLRVCDAANLCIDASDTIGWDKTAPTLACTVPNQTIWYAANVEVPCTAVDNGSGLDVAADASFTLSTNVAVGSESAAASTGSKTVADDAGNSATAGPYTFKVDRKAPTISCSPTSSLAWHSDNVTVNCTAVDNGSGLDDAADASFTLTTNVAAGSEDATAATGSKTVADDVGHSATAGPYTFKVDRKAPTLACTVPNQTVWYAANVDVPCTAVDNGSGLDVAADANFTLSTNVAAGAEDATAATNSKTVADDAGNSATIGPYTFKVDRKAPTLACTVPNQTIWYAANVDVPCTAVDNGSGLDVAGDASFTLSTTVLAGSENATASTGSKTVADDAGNTATAGPYTFKVDRKAPTISCSPTSSLAWHSGNVTVNCTATDGGSGLDDPADASFTLTTNVAAGAEDATAATDSKTVADDAGNSATAGPYTFKVDRKAPTISCSPTSSLAWHNDNVTVNCTAVDNGSGLDDAADASFTLTTNVAAGAEDATAATTSKTVADDAGNSATAGPYTFKVDRKAPTLACTVPNQTVWYAANVDVPCTAVDNGSGLDVAADANFTLSTNVAAGAENATASTGSKTVADDAGNSATIGPYTFKVDRKAPTISCSPTSSLAWHNDNVTVNCTAVDNGSGLDDAADASFTLMTNVASGAENTAAATGSKTVADDAGNSATAGPYTFKVDRKAPTISCSPTSSLAWHNDNVTVNCTAVDNGSGLATAADASFTLTTNVAPGAENAAAATGSKTVADAVGNSATAGPYTFKVDRKAPTLACTVPNQAIWYAANVNVPCTGEDNGSGLATAADASFTLTTNVAPGAENAAAATGSKTVADAVGNSATAGPYAFKVDRKGPVVTLVCPSSVTLGSSASANWTATDGGSGVASGYASGAIALDTSSVGMKTATAPAGTSKDNVDNNSPVATCTYNVNFDFSGFFAPIDRPNTMNVSRAGQAIPLKWRLTDALGSPITNLASVIVSVTGISCALGTTTDEIEEVAAGASTLQNHGDGYYQFNWKSPTSYAGSCKSVNLKLDGEVTPRTNLAFISFKK